MPAKLAKPDNLRGSGPVHYRVDGPSDAPLAIAISIDYSDAPIPDHYYLADYFEVVDQDPQMLFLFGKRDYPKRSELRNKIEVYFPSPFFIKQLWRGSREFHANLRKSIELTGYKSDQPQGISSATEKVQTLQANNVLIVQSGTECLMDFYYLSPRDLYVKVRKKQDLDLQPLVRVIMTHTLLLGFLDACEPIANALILKYPDREDANEIVESR
ncbi:MAG: hypothetical protein ACYDD2_10945 [Candidatus Acidiferrales bacterium]